jgi:hypothetical protein
MRAVGTHSKEDYPSALIESDCAASEFERILVDRLAGPFAPPETDWKERVRQQFIYNAEKKLVPAPSQSRDES